MQRGSLQWFGAAAFSICAASAACTAAITGDGAAPPGDDAPVGGAGAVGDRRPETGGTGGSAALASAPLPLRVLTREEYDHTVLDLFGAELLSKTGKTRGFADGFPGESSADTGFAKVQKLDEVNVQAYLVAAEAIAASAAADPKALLGCDPAAPAERSCVSAFVGTFGRRAYRRPLAAGEVAEHVAFYLDSLRGTQKLPVPEAVAALVTAMLQSPFFLYRWEAAWEGRPDAGAVKLSPHHLASQLSYGLWASMPDAELFAAADEGRLGTRAEVERQVRRMLADPRAERMIASFVTQWAGVAALPGALRAKAGWGPDLARAMVDEVARFTADVVLRGDGRLGTLFSSRTSRVNGPLAALYGQPATGNDLRAITFAADERAGLLTLAGVMAAHADENEPSPILRGKFVREHVMCDLIPPPPGGVPDLPPPDPRVPKRERFAMHAQASCAACHDLIDPIGFGFEHYDHVGAYRTTDGAFAIDARGMVTRLDERTQTFGSALELASLLAASPQVQACLARQFLRHGLGRREADEDAAALADAVKAAAAKEHDVRELLVALWSSRIATHRALAGGEVSP